MQDRTASIGLWIVIIPIIVLSEEAVPGWGFLGLYELLPIPLFFVIAVATGFLGGLLIDRECRIASAVGAAIAGPGALAVTIWHLSGTSKTHTAVLALLGLLGAIPGVLVYAVLRKILGKPQQTPTQ